MSQGILPGMGVNMSSTDDVADTAVEIAKHEAHSVEEQHKAHLAWCNRSLQSNAEAFINASQAVTDEIWDEIDIQATIDNLGSYNWYARCLTALFIIGAAPGCTRCARCDHVGHRPPLWGGRRAVPHCPCSRGYRRRACHQYLTIAAPHITLCAPYTGLVLRLVAALLFVGRMVDLARVKSCWMSSFNHALLPKGKSSSAREAGNLQHGSV